MSWGIISKPIKGTFIQVKRIFPMVVTLGGKSNNYKYWRGCEGRAAKLRCFSNSSAVRFPARFHWDRQDHLEDSLSHVKWSKNFKENPNCPWACPHLLPVQSNTNLGTAVQPKEFQQGRPSGEPSLWLDTEVSGHKGTQALPLAGMELTTGPSPGGLRETYTIQSPEPWNFILKAQRNRWMPCGIIVRWENVPVGKHTKVFRNSKVSGKYLL